MNVKRDIRFRVYIAFTAICLLGLAIVVKAALIQFKEGPKLRAQAREMHTRTDTLRVGTGIWECDAGRFTARRAG